MEEKRKRGRPRGEATVLKNFRIPKMLGNLLERKYPKKTGKLTKLVEPFLWELAGCFKTECLNCGYEFPVEMAKKDKCPECKLSYNIELKWIKDKKMIISIEEFEALAEELQEDYLNSRNIVKLNKNDLVTYKLQFDVWNG